MPDVEVRQMPAFKRAYKKLHKSEKAEADSTIREIIANPEIGEPKKGDLTGVYVHKFKINKQEMLLAYEWDARLRLLLLLGSHENFYRDLKR